MSRDNELYQKMIYTAADYIRAAVVKHLPHSHQKDFMLWILSKGNPFQEDYLRMLGVAGSIELEIHLLNSVVNELVFEKLQPYIAILNTYFAFETLSDNIGTGLSIACRDSNATYELQKKMLNIFNEAIIKKINHSGYSTIKLLSPLEDYSKHISAYEHCLFPAQMQTFAEEYLKKNKKATIADLEYSFYPILILNVESCVELLQSLLHHPIYSLLKQSLIDRYTAVTYLLSTDNNINYEILADLGAKSILVAPTLAYCIGSLDNVTINPLLKKNIDDGSLATSLYSASLLVRLLNDLGTNLLASGEEGLQNLMESLMKAAEQKPTTIFELLSRISKKDSLIYLLTRIRKDLTHGEFNVSLDNLKTPGNIDTSMYEFLNGIHFYTNLYKEHNETLLQLHGILSRDLLDSKVADIILNFVTFHEKMYSKKFELKHGDYAITRE